MMTILSTTAKSGTPIVFVYFTRRERRYDSSTFTYKDVVIANIAGRESETSNWGSYSEYIGDTEEDCVSRFLHV